MAELNEGGIVRHDPTPAGLAFEQMLAFSIANFTALNTICVDMWTPPNCEEVQAETKANY